MAKPNYGQAKRQKELARKARQEQKLRRRTARASSTPDEKQDTTPLSHDAPPTSSAPDA